MPRQVIQAHATGVKSLPPDSRALVQITALSNRHVVVDQNMLRSDQLEALLSDPNTLFVLPDAAIMEMAKAPQWESMMHRALKILSRVPERVRMTAGNGELMSLELRRQQPLALVDLFDVENTIVMEYLLRETAEGRRGAYYGWVERARPQRLQAMEQGHLNHARNFTSLQELVPTIVRAISPDHQKRLRRQEVSAQERVQIVSGITSAIFFTAMNAGGITDENAQCLFNEKSYLARYLWLRVRSILRWIEKGGHGTVKPTNATNDIVDSHYVLVGSYCDELLTKDTGACDADEELRLALACSFSWDIDVNYLSSPIPSFDDEPMDIGVADGSMTGQDQ